MMMTDMFFLVSEFHFCNHNVAHKKGSGYDKIAKEFGIGEKSCNEIFIDIMNQANAILEYIETNMDKFA